MSAEHFPQPLFCERLMQERKWPWPRRTLLAPMEGVTHPTFRHILAALGGIDLVCTEFVRITDSPIGRRHLERQVVRSPGARLSVQVMGKNLENLSEATRIVVGAGADVVDLNVGCPAPTVVRKGVGSAMLKDPELLFRAVQALRSHSKGPVSAKMRAGFDDADGAVQLATVMQAAGADFVTVHPRRRSDFYRGVADWRIIAALKAELRIPVVGNGDVWYAADALRMRRETGCDAVMIGRGAVRNPWIFQQIEALSQGLSPVCPNGADAAAYLEGVVRIYREEFSPRAALGQIKELLRYFGRILDDGGAFLKSALRAQTLDQVLRLSEQTLSSLAADELDLAASGGVVERSGSTSAGPMLAEQNALHTKKSGSGSTPSLTA